MTLIDRTAPSATVLSALGLVEDWLLDSGIQLDCGTHRGGVAGWLDRDGQPEFLYLEITGYYLTAMAWLSAGAASSSERAVTARRRARRAVNWIATVLQSHPAPPTRLYLSEHRPDWRNDAVFSFDLAMAARGLAATRWPTGRRIRDRAITEICAILARISNGAEVMVSHEIGPASEAAMPDRWSTRPGVHHLKAAAALLRLPARFTDDATVAMASRTCDHWTASFEGDDWPCQQLHASLYALEGMLIRADGHDDLHVVERAFARLMEAQAPDGTIAETAAGGIVRSDVLAQALRIALLLRGRGYLGGPIWTDRIDQLTSALLAHIRPDGGVLFSLEQTMSNAWCAMFAHQALYLRACAQTGGVMPPFAYQLLV